MKRPSTLAIALLGSLLLWAAQPPLALGWLGWIAPVPWLWLVRTDMLPGRRPYWTLWFAALVFWLAALHWLRLPHPAVYLGWFALSAYLSIYLPLFVGLSRVGVHRLRISLWIVAPIVWTGLEFARAHIMTGFMMGSLAHTQFHWPAVIQISDLVGEYGVDFVMILVASSITCVAFAPRQPLAVAPALLVLAATLFYGFRQLPSPTAPTSERNTVRIALIQGNSLADWKNDASKQKQIMSEYYELSKQALAKAVMKDNQPIHLVVWPETMFRSPLYEFEDGYELPEDATRTKEEIAAVGKNDLANLATQLDTPILVGVDRIIFLADDQSATDRLSYRGYNSSALVARDGKLLGTYDKFHLVMFGEYVPFSKWLPLLSRLSSITGSAEAGTGPVALEVDGVRYAPNICYETVIPHVIRNQVATLDAAGTRPDVLVNLTNDAWYWGSSELDMHLACDVFRAVETRTPLVIAANGGISAWIDRYGQVMAQSPRQQTDVILADVELNRDAPISLYVRTGDWFAALCLTACVFLAIIGWRARKSSTAASPAPTP
jgi:apolipoprotein N-acyltransferase